MVLLLHLPAGLQQVPKVLPEHVCWTSGPHWPSALTGSPVCVGGLAVDVARFC